MDAFNCRMEFGNSALTWRGLTVLLEEMRECAQFLRESYEFRNIVSYMSLFGGRVMFSTDARGHLIVTLELDSDGRDRQEACCVFHADQSSLLPFLRSLERFLRDCDE